METTLYASLFNYSPRRRTLRLADSSDGWFLIETNQWIVFVRTRRKFCYLQLFQSGVVSGILRIVKLLSWIFR
jgi:hypothetical protein